MCNQPVSNTTKYRFGADGCNSFADRHNGSSDDHPGGLTRRRAASSDRQGVAGSKCSGSTKDECDSTHNSCFYEQLRIALVVHEQLSPKDGVDHSTHYVQAVCAHE